MIFPHAEEYVERTIHVGKNVGMDGKPETVCFYELDAEIGLQSESAGRHARLWIVNARGESGTRHAGMPSEENDRPRAAIGFRPCAALPFVALQDLQGARGEFNCP